QEGGVLLALLLPQLLIDGFLRLLRRLREVGGGRFDIADLLGADELGELIEPHDVLYSHGIFILPGSGLWALSEVPSFMMYFPEMSPPDRQRSLNVQSTRARPAMYVQAVGLRGTSETQPMAFWIFR